MFAEFNNTEPGVADDAYFRPEEVTVFMDASGNLGLEIERRGRWAKVAVRLAFPYSEPARYVAFVHEGEPIGMLLDPAELDAQSRRLLEEELSKRYHVPEIVRVLSITESNNATSWRVETDKGPRQFLVRDRHNFRRIKGGDLVIVDVDGNRFRLAQARQLDPESKRLLDIYG